MKKSTIRAIGLCTLAVLLSASCSVDKQKVKEKIAESANFLHRERNANPVIVRTITVGEGDSYITSNYVGRVEPSKSVAILNRFPGTVEELNAVKGRRVSKGDVIARVKSESVQSAYDIARVTLEQAEDGYARAQKVYGSGSVTEVKMVEIRTQLEKARAAERSARQALEDCCIKAPFDGVVGDVYCHNGEQISTASPVVQILDIGSIEIHFNVPESEYADIPVGAKVDIEVPALKKTVTGTVAVKGVTASALSHSYDFTVKSISDAVSLMPGMVCKVRAVRGSGKGMVIPASSVMTDMNGRFIWGVTPGDTVCKTYVTTDGFAGNGIVITGGLSKGDRVIVDGSRKVSTGMKVIVGE